MSFALEYRKKLQARAREQQAVRKANEGFVALPVNEAADTRRNRRRVLCAVFIAGAFLAVFNSDGLVRYSYNHADSQAGRRLVVLSEKWHQLMQAGRLPDVVEQIRGSVMMVRHSSWQDLAGIFRSGPQERGPLKPGTPQVVPAKAVPLPKIRKPETPEMAKPAGPVMRASADALEAETR